MNTRIKTCVVIAKGTDGSHRFVLQTDDADAAIAKVKDTPDAVVAEAWRIDSMTSETRRLPHGRHVYDEPKPKRGRPPKRAETPVDLDLE